jgi:hypothetical protein
MKHVEKWRWRTSWGGRMIPGSVHFAEADIKLVHPEAEAIPGSMIVVDVPETPEEIDAAYKATQRRPRNFRPE